MITMNKVASFSKIKQQWNELYYHNTRLSYYQSVEYMKALWNNLLPYCFVLRVTPVFYVFKRDNITILILPLFKRWFKNQYSLYGFKSGVGYLDAIYSDTIRYEDITKCFEVLKNSLNGVAIHFEHVKADTELGKWIIDNGGTISTEGCTEIPLPDVYEDYYNSLSKHMKQNIRTAYNRLKTDGGIYRFESMSYSEMPEETEKDLQQLYLDRQVSKYEKNFFYKVFVKYVDLGTKIHKSDDVKVKAYMLYINDRIAAYFDAILADKTVIIPRLAIADGFNRYSPGVMLLNESIRELIEQKVKIIDLTHGTEQYKLSMGGIAHGCVETDLKLI